MDEMNSTPSSPSYLWVVYRFWVSRTADAGTLNWLLAEPGLVWQGFCANIQYCGKMTLYFPGSSWPRSSSDNLESLN